MQSNGKENYPSVPERPTAPGRGPQYIQNPQHPYNLQYPQNPQHQQNPQYRQYPQYPQNTVYPGAQAGKVNSPSSPRPSKLDRAVKWAAIVVIALAVALAAVLILTALSSGKDAADAAAPSDTEQNAAAVHEHRWGEWSVFVEPGCETGGSERRVCLDDASHTQERSLPMLGHDWAEATAESPRTCRRCGLQEGEPLSVPLEATVSNTQAEGKTRVYSSSAEASSFINSTHIGEAGITVRYPQSAADGSIYTSWQEAAPGYGIDEWLTLYLDAEADIRYITLYLGNWESVELYNENGRPDALRFDFSDGSSVTCAFNDSMEVFEVALSKSVRTEWIKITILGSYEGTKYEDTCITEVELYG